MLIGLGMGVLLSAVGYRIWLAPDQAQIALLRAEVSRLQEISDRYELEAAIARDAAVRADRRFEESLAKHESERLNLRQQIRDRSRRISTLEAELEDLQAGLENTIEELPHLTDDELAQRATTLVAEAYPEHSEGTFQFVLEAQSYVADKSAVLASSKALTETLSLRLATGKQSEQIVALRANMSDCEDVSDTLRSDLDLARLDITKWQEAVDAGEALNQAYLDRLEAQEKLTKALERKMRWTKVGSVLSTVGAGVGGYLIGKQLQ